MKFFNLDSPLMKFLNRMTDVLWLNILTLLCCILIIPAGAGFTALHYVCLKMVRDEEGYVTKDFFKSFKENFLQATAIWLMILVVGVVVYVDYKCLSYVSNPTIMFAAISAAVIFVLCTALYCFPVLSHFKNTIRGTIKNSFFMSILALPRTILMILLNLLPVAILLCVEYFETMTWLIPLTVLFWFSVPAYFSAKLYNKVFRRFEPEEAKVDLNDDFTWTVGGKEELPEDGEVSVEDKEEQPDIDEVSVEEKRVTDNE